MLHIVKQYQYGIYIAVCMLLVGGIGYNVGRISALQKSDLTVNSYADIADAVGGTAKAGSTATKTKAPAAAAKPAAPRDPRVVVSKNSSGKVYHYSWCGGVKQIKETNKVWFDTEAAAIAAGYTLAGNCQ